MTNICVLSGENKKHLKEKTDAGFQMEKEKLYAVQETVLLVNTAMKMQCFPLKPQKKTAD